MAIFDKEAATYDQWYETKLGWFVDEVESECALSLFSPPQGSRVLEVGCGTGNFSVKLARKGYKVVGVDLSAEMLKVARQKAAVESLPIENVQMDAHRLAFADASFDGAFTMATFEFLKNPGQALREMFRAVTPESPILVGTINRDSAWGKLYQSAQFESTVFRHAHLRTPEEMRQLKPENLVRVQECLFIAPDVDVEHLDIGQARQQEHHQMPGRTGGFVCLLWRK